MQAQLNADIMEASSRCQAMGFKKNSDQMNLCVMTTVQTIAEERALAFQRSQAAWASIKAAGEALYRARPRIQLLVIGLVTRLIAPQDKWDFQSFVTSTKTIPWGVSDREKIRRLSSTL